MTEPIDEIERKFRVSFAPQTWEAIGAKRSFIQQHYYRTEEGVVERLRLRVHYDEEGLRMRDTEQWTLTTKDKVGPGHYREDEKVLPAPVATAYIRSDENTLLGEVRKERFEFEWEGRVWEFDHYFLPNDVYVLEVELEDVAELKAAITTPPFLDVVGELTGLDYWSNLSMALPGWDADPRLEAGRVWVKDDESFLVLSTEDEYNGIRAYAQSFEFSDGCKQSSPKLAFISVDELIREGWRPKG